MTYRPKIGISMRLEIPSRRFYLGRDYSEALVGAGASPVHIPLIPDKGFLADLAAGLDGILLPGSDTDVDPARFGEQPHPNLGTVIDEKDRTDLFLLEEAERIGLPVFAICFGMQVLNVFRGGTLIQDIGSQVERPIKHQQGLPLERRSHSIQVEPNSLLEKALGVGLSTTKVNSHHHQAIGKIGNDLQSTAFAPDGVVEAIEDTRNGRFNFGAQWHPEIDWRNDPLSLALFGEFVKAAEGRRAAISGS
jgi:putative glutamine amidotransferase